MIDSPFLVADGARNFAGGEILQLMVDLDVEDWEAIEVIVVGWFTATNRGYKLHATWSPVVTGEIVPVQFGVPGDPRTAEAWQVGFPAPAINGAVSQIHYFEHRGPVLRTLNLQLAGEAASYQALYVRQTRRKRARQPSPTTGFLVNRQALVVTSGAQVNVDLFPWHGPAYFWANISAPGAGTAVVTVAGFSEDRVTQTYVDQWYASDAPSRTPRILFLPALLNTINFNNATNASATFYATLIGLQAGYGIGDA